MKKNIWLILVICGLSGCSANKSTQKAVHRETVDSFVRTQSDSLRLTEKKWTDLKGMEQTKLITLSTPDDNGRQYVESIVWQEKHWQQADSGQLEKTQVVADTVKQTLFSQDDKIDKKQKTARLGNIWRYIGILAVILFTGFYIHKFM